MNIMNIISFIESPVGILSISIIGSILGTWLYKSCQKLYIKASGKVKNTRFKNRLIKVGEMFCSGYTASYAENKSHFHQLLHVNKFTISLLMDGLRIVIFVSMAIGLLILFQEYFVARAVIIALSSIIIAVQYQKIKFLFQTYQIMYDHVFGDEYKKHMMDGMKQYWGKLTKKEECKGK